MGDRLVMPSPTARAACILRHLQPAQQLFSSSSSPDVTAAELARHNTKTDCWVQIGDTVWALTNFLSEHPGGEKVIMLYAGKDGTEEFNMLHRPGILESYA